MSGRVTLDEEQARQLGSPGWFLREGFLGAELAGAVKAQALALSAAGGLHRAGVRRGADHHLDDSVRNDEIAWLDQAEVTGAFAAARARFEALREAVNQSAWLGLRGFELQLARYAAGGHYQRHRDAFPGDDNRRLTALVYLNDAWRPEHGGCLRIHGEGGRDVEPVLDRLVVFRSEVVEHEVLSSSAERWALAAWYSAR